jgi:exopolysaccharide biosynthesis WecB/TagA/CpsF family protein
MAIGLAMMETDESGAPGRDILGVAIADVSRAEALGRVERAISGRSHLKIAFCNAHTANTACSDPAFRAALKRFLVLPDGVGVDMAARWLGGAAFKANLNGTDFVPEILGAAKRPLRIALIGGRPGVAQRAAEVFAGLGPGHEVVPVLDGFSGPDDEARWLAALAAEPVDLALVAMGNPRQEFWIDAHLDAGHASVAIGVGALFDFLAGEVARAPGFVRELRLEWMWRLMLEPRRLFVRYVVGNPLFVLRVLAAKFRTARK